MAVILLSHQRVLIAGGGSVTSVVHSAEAALSAQMIKERLFNINSAIDLRYTDEVGRRINEYTVRYPKAGAIILGKVDLYFPLIEKEIRKYDLPEDLKYIPIVESNLDPHAKSSAGALGLWQFISSTAEMQGLQIDKYVDERKDPEKSTRAAIQYLMYLHDIFDDWTLAFAAYNCGPGNVKKAIRRGNSRNYWDIRRHLPRETQKYIPRIVAAIYLMEHYDDHEIVPIKQRKQKIQTKKVPVENTISFSKLSQEMQVSLELIRMLNPQYDMDFIPKNDGIYNLTLPASVYLRYLGIYEPQLYEEFIMREEEAEMLIQIQKKANNPDCLPQLNSKMLISLLHCYGDG